MAVQTDSTNFRRTQDLDMHPVRTIAAAMEQMSRERAAFVEAMTTMIRELRVEMAAPNVTVEPRIEITVPPIEMPPIKFEPLIDVQVPPITIPPAQVTVMEKGDDKEEDDKPKRKELVVHRDHTGLIKSIDIICRDE